jgi:hypothetical protein
MPGTHILDAATLVEAQTGPGSDFLVFERFSCFGDFESPSIGGEGDQEVGPGPASLEYVAGAAKFFGFNPNFLSCNPRPSAKRLSHCS